jgi:hypothetical protein
MMADDFLITNLQSREICRPCWAQHMVPLLAGQSVSAGQPEAVLYLPSSALRISFFDILLFVEYPSTLTKIRCWPMTRCGEFVCFN